MEEQIISFAPQFNLDKVSRTIGDFVFTNERILFVNTLKGADILLFFWSSAPFVRRKKNSKDLIDKLEALKQTGITSKD